MDIKVLPLPAEKMKDKIKDESQLGFGKHFTDRMLVAEWKAGKLTVWTGTQRPFGVRGELAEVFRIPEEKIRVIVPDTGSAYGGKHTGECAIEAARIAKAAGKPVKLVWSREEEFTWAYFRPAGVIRVTSGVSNDGKITAWEFHNYNSGPAAIEPKYDIPNLEFSFIRPTRLCVRALIVPLRLRLIISRAKLTSTNWPSA